MGERTNNASVHIGGNVTGQFISPIQFEGNENNINFNSNPGGSADNPGNPIPSEVLSVQNKVKRKTEELREAGEDFPQRELLRRKLIHFYQNTTDPDGLADQLYQNKLLNDFQRQKIKNEKLDYHKNNILYDIVTSKEAVVELLPALKKSGNEHILRLIDELAS